MYKVPGRAYTNEEKEAVCAAILAAWKDAPHQRLGQLIDNALQYANTDPRCSYTIFYVEDDKLVEQVAEFVADHPTISSHVNEDGECTTCGFQHTGGCNPDA